MNVTMAPQPLPALIEWISSCPKRTTAIANVSLYAMDPPPFEFYKEAYVYTTPSSSFGQVKLKPV